MRHVLAIASGLALLTACSTPAQTHGYAVHPVTPPRSTVTVLLTVTQDDCCASKATISYVDPTSGLTSTTETYYAWSKSLGPFSSLRGDLWLSVDNTAGRTAAHCSIRVSDQAQPVIGTIPAGQAGACSAHLAETTA